MAKKTVSMFASYEEIQNALKEIGEIDIKVEVEEGEVNKKVNEIKQQAQGKVAPLLERRKVIEQHVQLFAEERKKEDFIDKKSIELVFGKIGFRSTGGGIRVKNNKSTVEALIGLGAKFKHLLITEHKPNKEALEGVSDDFLKQIGCSRTKKTDKFWFEINREKISDDKE